MTTLYARLGGRDAIRSAVERFYAKVLADERVKGFFDGVDMTRQKAKQVGFLTMVTGGPNRYTGKDMRDGHRHLVERGLNDGHVDAIVELLGETLREVGADEADVKEAAAIAESVRDDVLDR